VTLTTQDSHIGVGHNNFLEPTSKFNPRQIYACHII
jgi:hypothetical protein